MLEDIIKSKIADMLEHPAPGLYTRLVDRPTAHDRRNIPKALRNNTPYELSKHNYWCSYDLVWLDELTPQELVTAFQQITRWHYRGWA